MPTHNDLVEFTFDDFKLVPRVLSLGTRVLQFLAELLHTGTSLLAAQLTRTKLLLQALAFGFPPESNNETDKHEIFPFKSPYYFSLNYGMVNVLNPV